MKSKSFSIFFIIIFSFGFTSIIMAQDAAEMARMLQDPLGLGVSKTLAVGSIGVEPLVGYYWNVVRPDGAADQVFRWAVNFLF